MRKCHICQGKGMVQDEYQDQETGEWFYDDEVVSGIVDTCWMCEGSGELEGCYCSARCVCECGCGYEWQSDCYCWEDA